MANGCTMAAQLVVRTEESTAQADQKDVNPLEAGVASLDLHSLAALGPNSD